MEKYELTEEHRLQLKPWADWWIANAMSTKPMSPEEIAIVREAIKGIYEAADLVVPEEQNIVFVSSPFVARITSGIIAAAWHKGLNDVTIKAVQEAVSESIAGSFSKIDKDSKDQLWYNFPKAIIKDLSDKFGVGELGVECCKEAWKMYQGGNFWSAGDSFYSFFKDVVKLDIDYSKYKHWQAAAEHSSVRFVHEKFCIISDRPEVLTVDAQNRPHNDTGAFCKWRDGTALYAYHGVYTPSWIIDNPSLITVDDINGESNAEIKRIMINKYGAEKFLDDIDAKEIDRDRDTKGEQILYSYEKDDITIRMIKLENSTPEKDGSKKWYSFRVPPETQNCKAAVAWMFGVEDDKYNPIIET